MRERVSERERQREGGVPGDRASAAAAAGRDTVTVGAGRAGEAAAWGGLWSAGGGLDPQCVRAGPEWLRAFAQ